MGLGPPPTSSLPERRDSGDENSYIFQARAVEPLRPLADLGRAMVRAAAAAASAREARALQGWSSARSGAQGHERNPLRLAHRLPVERAECDRNLQQLDRALAISGMGRGGRLPPALGQGIEQVRRVARNSMALAVNGRSHDQGSARRGKKPEPIPPTEPKAASNAAYCVKGAAFPSVSQSTVLTTMTYDWSKRRWTASPSSGQGFGRTGVSTCASTRGMTSMQSALWSLSSVTRRISALAAKKPSRSSRALASRRDAGSLSARTVGLIGSAIFLCDGRRRSKIISASFTSSVPSLRFVMLGF